MVKSKQQYVPNTSCTKICAEYEIRQENTKLTALQNDKDYDFVINYIDEKTSAAYRRRNASCKIVELKNENEKKKERPPIK